MKFKLKPFFAGAIIAGFVVTSAWTASAAEVSTAPTGPAYVEAGVAGTTMEPGELEVSLKYGLAKGGTVKVADEGQQRWYPDMDKKLHVTNLTARYGIMDNLDVRAKLPYYAASVEMEGFVGEEEADGFGDLEVTGHYTFFEGGETNPLSVGLDLGFSAPTGSTGDDSIEYFGNDAWGFHAGLGATYLMDAHRVDVEGMFTTKLEGEDDYKVPNTFEANLHYAYALNDSFDVGVEGNYIWSGESEIDEKGQDNSWQELFAGPKIGFKNAAYGLSGAAAITVPIYTDYDALAVEDDYRFSLRLTKDFDL